VLLKDISGRQISLFFHHYMKDYRLWRLKQWHPDFLSSVLDVGGVNELIEDEVNGILVEKHNPEKLSAAYIPFMQIVL